MREEDRGLDFPQSKLTVALKSSFPQRSLFLSILLPNVRLAGAPKAALTTAHACIFICLQIAPVGVRNNEKN